MLEFTPDAAEFLAAAAPYLAADPVVSTVVAGIAQRAANDVAPPKNDWWLIVRDSAGTVVGAGMRTAPFAPRPLFLLPMRH